MDMSVTTPVLKFPLWPAMVSVSSQRQPANISDIFVTMAVLKADTLKSAGVRQPLNMARMFVQDDVFYPAHIPF